MDLKVIQEEMVANRERAKVWLLPLLSRLDLPGNKVLNVGCGVGTDVIFLCEAGWDAYGLDPGNRSAIWTQHGKYKGRFVIGKGEELPFRDNVFDLVTAFEVIESY